MLVKPLGLNLPIYPAKGYSVTMPVKDASMAHQVSLTDDEFKLVFSRYTSEQGDRLRIAGTAELNGYDRDLNPVRCQAIVRRVEELFPGQSRVQNLFLNTGHGTLGWTHSCGSGKSLARIVSGLAPEVDFAFVGAGAARTASGGLVPVGQ